MMLHICKTNNDHHHHHNIILKYRHPPTIIITPLYLSALHRILPHTKASAALISQKNLKNLFVISFELNKE